MYQRQLLFLFSLINSQQDNVRVLELCTNAEEVNLCLMDLQPKQAGSEAEACLSVQLQWQNPVPSVIRAVQTKKTAILLSDTELVKDYLHRKREETESLTRDDPLCVYYGKENTPIRFPYNINTSLEQLRKRRRIEETRNVASCSIGILHSKGVYVKGKKQAKVFSRMVVCSHYDAESYSSQHGPAIHHFERTKAGYKVYQEHLKASGKWTIDDSLNVISYSPLHHLHSEQMICDYLDGLTMGNFFQQFADKNEKLQFVKGCKIYAVTIDIESTNSSCLNCKMAFLAMLRPNPSLKKSFIKKFALHARGKYVLAGNKRNENNLHCVVRVLGNRQYKTKNYQNPDESNIKKLNNLGVFEMVRDQSQAPTVFVSGSK